MHEYLGSLEDVPAPAALEEGGAYTLPLLWLPPDETMQPHQLHPFLLGSEDAGEDRWLSTARC
jgi:hypothetical protein